MEPRAVDCFVEVKETLLGRTLGAGAARNARELRRADAFGTVRSLLFGQHTAARAWRRDANGERLVGLVIGRLPEGWHVLHGVPVGERGANVDHLVVGPAGAFTLNAKHLTGKVWIGSRSIRHNGHPTPFLRESAQEASRASSSLTAAVSRPIQVRGVLVILADEWTIKEKPNDVHVGSPRGVKDWLLRLPVVLSPPEVIEIAAAAGTPSTWDEASLNATGDQVTKRSVSVRPASSTSSGVEFSGS